MMILQEADHRDMLEKLSLASCGSSSDYLNSARECLARLLKTPDLLDAVDVQRSPGEYTRNLIYGDERITVYAIVWAPGARTSIHDHHCSCCFGMLEGTMQEDWYHALDATLAKPYKRLARSAGDIVCMLPSGPNLHRMRNDTEHEAISIHIYGYGGHTRPSSIGREYALCDSGNSQ